MAPATKQTRQGKRKPGTELISFPAPKCIKAQLQDIARETGAENLSALMRKISAQYIAKRNAARKGRAS